MVKKLVVMVMAVLFSLSVAGLGFAAEEKKPATAPAAEKSAQPCAGGEMKEKPKKTKKSKKAKKPAATTGAEKPAEKPAAPAGEKK